ncbi:MAG: UDP-N-acetylmuramoyl-tripeptide--D-alanyl-D-alanine ligase, partial [Clostridia bacterium]|nr:UDP-N-acetylmuramoyl-tripeptide--D-alanyl-D-alanine ligase [Clostridia bacterium]
TSPEGSAFTLVISDRKVQAHTKLLGVHNIQNIVGAAAVASALGVADNQLAAGIAKLEAVEHRLQIVRKDGVTVIDDAYNASPHGARAALEVIKEFPGRKIVITPGLVELGEAETEENRELGRAIAEAANILITVGLTNRAEALAEGYKQSGGAEDTLWQAENLTEATEILGAILKTGDVVLFENDLPDYMEV